MFQTTAFLELLSSKSWFIDKHLSVLQHPLQDSVEKLVLISDYACRQIGLLVSLLAKDPCNTLLQREDYFSSLNNLKQELPQTLYMRELRYFRHTHFLRLLLLEIAGIASTQEVMRSWSDCADALILHALNYCICSVSARYGTPKDEKGQEVHLYTLAMGEARRKRVKLLFRRRFDFCLWYVRQY